MVRSPCCEKLGLKKGPWSPEEDQKLLAYIQKHGHGNWRALPAHAGLDRCGKSCRLRWANYLRPDIKRGEFSVQEEQSIIQLHALLGNRWSAIATHLPKRTDNEIKNYWNTNLKKRLDKMGIDPVTHRPKMDAFTSCTGDAKDAANLSHMAQWESARLEAETRLVRESRIIQNQIISSSIKAGPQPPRPPCLDVLKAWQGVVSGMFFAASSNSGDPLESPTTPLNFSERNAMLTIPTIGCNQQNYSKIFDCTNSSSNNNNNNFTSRIDGGVLMASSAWSSGEFVKRESSEDNLGTVENIMEGLLDVLAGCGSGHDRYEAPMSTIKVNDGNCSESDGNFDQDINKDYWSSLLNVLDTSLMS